ncbi:MAG TPA: aldehyde dehydrogenase family protein [Candidatus Binatia bacterium]|nr:aldehyde dehydrogenase family protein [Candidatus Binatia bacterium]
MLRISNPANGSLIREIPDDSAASVAAKYRAARGAQPAWAARPIAERIAVLEVFKARVAARRDELARTLTREMGKPLRQSFNEIDALGARLDFFLDHAASVLAPETVLEAPADKLTERITHEPLGVIANISAWNYPYFVGTNTFVPALLAGNTVLYKPSELATLTGLAIGEMLHDAGVPADVFAVVVGAGAAGAALVEQPVDGVFFTGSYATGAKIAAVCAPRMVKLQLELGGKDPSYVCDDADVRTAAESLADGAMYNAGQSCCAVERIYVHEKSHDAFLAAFVATVKGYKVGDPMDESVYLGPLARAPQLAVLERQVTDAVAKGARVVVGGKRIERPGNWFEATVVADVDHTMELMREESFGPVIGIQRVSGDDAAVALMNDTEYGLTAGVYTPDECRARSILSRVRVGSVYWNCCDRVSPRLPWSGVGHSGVGLTLSTYGIQAFTRPKAWHLKTP